MKKNFIYFLEWIIEFILFASYPVKTFFYFFVPIHQVVNNSQHKTPIIIVELWFSQNIYHYFLKRYLEKNGFRVYMFNSNLFINGIDDGAQELDEFMNERKISKAVLVGISLGGLCAYQYFRKYGWERIEKLVTIGAPFYGTPWIFPLFLFKAGRELIPGSKFVNTLKAEKITNPDRIVCLTAKYDELVPDESSVLKGARHIEVDVVGHNFLHILSKETYEQVAKESLRLDN